MIGRGDLSRNPQKKLRVILGIQIVWLGLICLLGAWWGYLLFEQAERIAELEKIAGISSPATEANWAKTHRMILWESITFFVFLTISLTVLFWLYRREVRRSQSIKAFFASMTHELKTPLTSIRLQAESISDQVSDPEQEKLVTRLLEDTSRLEGQIERTLELARVEGGGQVHLENLLVKPWIERVIHACEANHSHRLKIHVDLEEHWIQADPTAVQIVVRNLIDNSIRHAKTDHLEVRLRTQMKDDWVCLEYQDNGKKIDTSVENLKKLFYRGSGSTGTGVGLYLVSVLMRQMGGEAIYRLDSHPDQGFQASLQFKRGVASHV